MLLRRVAPVRPPPRNRCCAACRGTSDRDCRARRSASPPGSRRLLLLVVFLLVVLLVLVLLALFDDFGLGRGGRRGHRIGCRRRFFGLRHHDVDQQRIGI